jgi:predicted MFS family arabinose efflux permease
MHADRRLAAAGYAGFAAFGTVWGVWGASLPRVQERAAVSDGQLGLALLLIGAGALPAILTVGRVIDRHGLKIGAGLVSILGVVAAAVGWLGTDDIWLCCGLLVLGAASGSADVGINTIAGRAERACGRRIIARAHAVFSAAVVLSSLSTGLMFAAGASLVVPFAAVAALCTIAGGLSVAALGNEYRGHQPLPGDSAPASRPVSEWRADLGRLVILGSLGALAFACENAQQSWSAVYAHSELGASVGLSAAAPAVFAAAVAVSRLTLGHLPDRGSGPVIVGGSLAAAGGALIIGLAPDLPADAAGLAVAAAGTGVLFPCLLAVVTRTTPAAKTGCATSLVTGVSYLGFLLGPVYVGTWAGVAGLRGAMLAVAALGLIIAMAAPPALRHNRARN